MSRPIGYMLELNLYDNMNRDRPIYVNMCFPELGEQSTLIFNDEVRIVIWAQLKHLICDHTNNVLFNFSDG